MKRTKSTLITIIVLLVFFAPLAIYSTFIHFMNTESIKNDNPNHEFKYNNKLYFYDKNDSLIANYECISEDCGKVETIIDDDKYKIDYYKDGENKEFNYDDSEFAYIKDNDKIHLYNLTLKKAIISFDAFKNYYTNIDNDLIIAKKDGKWGLLSLALKTTKINYEYDFLGLKNNIKNDKLVADNFIAMKDNKWFIISSNNEIKSKSIDQEIMTYTDLYIIDYRYNIYDYDGNNVIPTASFKNVAAVDNYIIGVTEGNVVMVYHNLNESVLGYVNIGDYSKLSYKLNDNKIDVYDNEELKQSIALN